MSAGSTPERAAYQSVSLTPVHAPIYQQSDDAGDTSNPLVTPHPNGPKSTCLARFCRMGLSARDGRLIEVPDLEPSYDADDSCADDRE